MAELASHRISDWNSYFRESPLRLWRRVFRRLQQTQGDPLKSHQVMEAAVQEVEREAKSDPVGQAMNAYIFPVFSQSGQRIIQTEAMRRMRTLKVELLKSRLKNGAFPKYLNGFDAKTITDPFNGKQLICRREGKGFILYSVGENGTDDGGQRKVGSNYIADIVTTYP